MATTGCDAEARAREPMAYFAHDSNAAQDFKCQKLLARWGNEGYGAWWRLCEMLASATGHALLLETDEDWTIVATQTGMLGTPDDGFAGAGKCKVFMRDLVEIGLIVQGEDGRFSSARMQRNAHVLGAQKAAGSKGGRPRKNARPDEE